MKQVFDTNGILFEALSSNSDLVNEITGGVYNGERPLNSKLEDVVINTIVLSQDSYPQFGVSNINIHVKDMSINFGGVQQFMPDNVRMATISEKVLSIVRAAKITGLTMQVESQNITPERTINEHFVNIRINWNIHI